MPTESIPRDLLVEVRRPDYQRGGQIDDRDISDLTLVVRDRNLGAWSVTLPADSDAASELRVPGAGIVASLNGVTLLSGLLTKATVRQRRGEPDEIVLEGVDDNWVLSDLAWPNPASADLSRQQGSDGYDIRSGPAETVIRSFVAANVGPSAPTPRRLSVLALATDGGRGRLVTGRARFTPLGELLSELAGVAGLTFAVRAFGDGLRFEVGERRDLRRLVRFNVDDDTADEAEYSYELPGLTRAIVAGQGQGGARVFVERSSAESLAAEVLWGRRVYEFVDRRDESDVAGLQQAGDERLAEEGATRVGLSVRPVDTPLTRFGVDWRVGDVVSATVRDVVVEDVVAEATVRVGGDGLEVSAVLGDPDVAARRPVLQLLAEQRRLRSSTGRLERA